MPVAMTASSACDHDCFEFMLLLLGLPRVPANRTASRACGHNYVECL